MSKPRTFRQSDVERAIRAAQRLGLTVTGYKVNASGEIEVSTGAAPSAPARELTPAEKWLAERNGKAA